MKSPKMILLALAFGGLLLLFLGWFLIASAADLFVLYHIKPKHGYYTSFQYTDSIWFYVFLSFVYLCVFFNIRAYVRRWKGLALALLCLTFFMFLGTMIADDIETGRPIMPEICFSLLILVFHLSLFSGAIKIFRALSRVEVSRLFN